MTDLQKLLASVKERAALPEAHEHSSPTVYAGHEFESARLEPIITTLLAIIEADQAALARIASGPFDIQVGGVGDIFNQPNGRTLTLRKPQDVARDAQSAALASLKGLCE